MGTCWIYIRSKIETVLYVDYMGYNSNEIIMIAVKLKLEFDNIWYRNVPKCGNVEFRDNLEIFKILHGVAKNTAASSMNCKSLFSGYTMLCGVWITLRCFSYHVFFTSNLFNSCIFIRVIYVFPKGRFFRALSDRKQFNIFHTCLSSLFFKHVVIYLFIFNMH